jgi:hypothetical protein
MVGPAEPAQQSRQFRPVLLVQGNKFQAQPHAGSCVAYDGVGPDLPFLHQKMQSDQDAFGLGLRRFKKHPPMLMSRTLDTSSRPWHCQYTQTSPGAVTREVNLLEGEVDRKRGLPGTMV